MFGCFCNVFLQRHGNLHICRHKTVPKHLLYSVSNSLMSPQTLENTAIYTVFFNFSMFQCCWPTQTYIQKILQKHCFFAVFLQCFPSKTPQFTRFSAWSRSKTLVFAVFSMLWHPTSHSKHRYLMLFTSIYSVFSFLSILPLPEAYQNDPKFHFNTLLSSDTQKSSKNRGNTT